MLIKRGDNCPIIGITEVDDKKAEKALEDVKKEAKKGEEKDKSPDMVIN